MSSYAQLYAYFVWATWNRLSLITPNIEPQLYAALAAKCAALGCTSLSIGGTSDYIHVLVQFVPTISLARLIGEMKGTSSHLMTHTIFPGEFFKWHSGYGVFTVSKRDLPQVQDYIFEQKKHHATGKLITELERTSQQE